MLLNCFKLQKTEWIYPNNEPPPNDVPPKPMPVPVVFVPDPNVEPLNRPVPVVFPKSPPGFWAVFPKREFPMPRVFAPNPEVLGVVEKPKLVLVAGLNNEEVLAVEVPNVFVPKFPNPVLDVVPNPPVFTGLAPNKPVFVEVFVPNEKPEVVVVPRLKFVAGLFWPNKPID